MAENKKDKPAEFARDKSAFSKGGSEKGTASQKVQRRHSGTHQPRDANDTFRDVQKKEQSETFGQNVHKSGQSAKRRNKKQYQKQDTFGHSDHKSENMDADSKKKSDFSQENNTFTEEDNREQEEHQQKDDYHRRDTYHQSEKKGKYHRREYQNRERKIATRYYCDEFHLLLKERQTAIYSVEIWKRFRKWGGIPTGLTQNVGDFLRSEEIEGILGNSDFVYLLNQNAKDQAILADKLGLSDKQLSYVTNSEPGSGLILFDNVVIPFVDKYPTDTKTYKIMNTKPEESVQKEDAV